MDVLLYKYTVWIRYSCGFHKMVTVVNKPYFVIVLTFQKINAIVFSYYVATPDPK